MATLKAIGLRASMTTASGRVLITNGLLDQLLILGSRFPTGRRLLKETIALAATGLAMSRSIVRVLYYDLGTNGATVTYDH